MPRGNRERSANTRSLGFACSPSEVRRRNILNFLVILHKDTFLFRFLKPQAETYFFTQHSVTNHPTLSPYHTHTRTRPAQLLTPLLAQLPTPLLTQLPTPYLAQLLIPPSHSSRLLTSHISLLPTLLPTSLYAILSSVPPHPLPRVIFRAQTYDTPFWPTLTKKRSTSFMEAPLGFRYFRVNYSG